MPTAINLQGRKTGDGQSAHYLALRPSRFLFWIAVSLHGLALLVVCLPEWPWWVIPPFWLLIGFLFHHVRQHDLAQPVAVLALDPTGLLAVLWHGEADFHPADLQTGSTVLPWLVLLPLVDNHTLPARAITLTLLPDSVETPEAFRQLRVWLRWQGQVGP